jgi:hypothetical protein
MSNSAWVIIFCFLLEPSSRSVGNASCNLSPQTNDGLIMHMSSSCLRYPFMSFSIWFVSCQRSRPSLLWVHVEKLSLAQVQAYSVIQILGCCLSYSHAFLLHLCHRGDDVFGWLFLGIQLQLFALLLHAANSKSHLRKLDCMSRKYCLRGLRASKVRNRSSRNQTSV